MFSIQIATTAMTAATTAAPSRAYGTAVPTSARRTDFGADLGGRGVKAPAAHRFATVPGILCLETTDLLRAVVDEPPGRGTRNRDPRPLCLPSGPPTPAVTHGDQFPPATRSTRR